MNSEQPAIPFHRLLHACAAPSAEAAWESFLTLYGQRLRAEVRAALIRAGAFPARDLLDDLAQEVLCRLLERDRRALADFRGASAGEAAQYLRRVVASVVVDALRAAAAAKRRPACDPVSLETFAEDTLYCGDRRGCPEARALAREELRVLFRRVRRLLGARATPDRLRALRLALVVGLSSREVAARLGGGWTEGAVDSLIYRLRRRLAGAGWPAPARRDAPGDR